MSDQQTTRPPCSGAECTGECGGCAGRPESPPLALCSVEIDALKHALDALAALQSAQLCTRDGIASDYLQNAADEVRKAMGGMGA